ncbi:ferritin [Alkaliphilus peptidifermentans]|uniref:Ferritin n=1 Tax=Alkaliphilus peptidifermentans DSM 18978 TaxID=1120976 RepID=A0A1G5HLR4_9FIRM|nr:ferritin [Alkaliphilus peptidifermentans]SCY64634.1 ferritin [Alkaliphilus peptidifermentans DSM 18978]
MLSENLIRKLNEQVKHEFYSSNYYLAMASYCKELDLDGFANFFIVQAEEERFHAMKLFNFINEIGGRAIISGLDEPQNSFSSLEEVFHSSLKHEEFVTELINQLMDLAITEKNYATVSFLNWFVDEQVEEMAMMNSLLKRVRRIIGNDSAIYMMDDELAKRIFTPPVQ